MTMHPQSIQIFLLLEGLGGLMRFMEHHRRRSLSLRKKVSSEMIHGKTTWIPFLIAWNISLTCDILACLYPARHQVWVCWIQIHSPSQDQDQVEGMNNDSLVVFDVLLISTRLNRQLRQLNLSLQPLLDKTPTTFYMTTVGNAHLSQYLLMPSTSLTNLSWTGRSTLQLS